MRTPQDGAPAAAAPSAARRGVRRFRVGPDKDEAAQQRHLVAVKRPAVKDVVRTHRHLRKQFACGGAISVQRDPVAVRATERRHCRRHRARAWAWRDRRATGARVDELWPQIHRVVQRLQSRGRRQRLLLRAISTGVPPSSLVAPAGEACELSALRFEDGLKPLLPARHGTAVALPRRVELCDVPVEPVHDESFEDLALQVSVEQHRAGGAVLGQQAIKVRAVGVEPDCLHLRRERACSRRRDDPVLRERQGPALAEVHELAEGQRRRRARVRGTDPRHERHHKEGSGPSRGALRDGAVVTEEVRANDLHA